MTVDEAGGTVFVTMASAARKKATPSDQPKPRRGPIKIQVNRSIRGATYGLDGDSRRAIQATYPDLRAAPSVYVATESEEDFERVHSKMWKQIALVLTGLPTAKLRQLGVVLVDPVTRTELARPFAA
ncbi:hypothetical protein [Nannocystis pusilla]|uniref:Uncharacterized protein n=1 Tax=Nannocystis pusilla TaxID=889268 RepID=A0ABS7U043_9BACT|nr:hypothetical protein [Nannocystis pusilla]MBZ5713740.1 hypothetical protein [Nannocystis pusilla]